MGRTIQTIKHRKIFSELRLFQGLTVRIEDCAYLAKKFQAFGVEDYYLSKYEGNSYLTRYMDYYVDFLPTWEYKKEYLIPLIFRETTDTQSLFKEAYRWQAFFQLLDWYLTYLPEKALVGDQKTARQKKVVDTAFLSFRLAEICDGAAFPISNLQNLTEFEQWDQVFHLIDTKRSFRARNGFDETKIEDLTQLEVIISMIKLKYSEKK